MLIADSLTHLVQTSALLPRLKISAPIIFLAILACGPIRQSHTPIAEVEVIPHIQFDREDLIIDGEKAPFLFGASTQYFRARGGPGRNVPATKVYELWERLLDRVLEAHMNTVSIYIPWDFHEPEEGIFDFDGHLDRDGDGLADYPSRNLRYFLARVRARGIRHVMIRPGPYINAEWGPSGFGAIPGWLLKHRDGILAETHDLSDTRKFASYNSTEFQFYVRRWFTNLYREVLHDHIGPKNPIDFIQLDNETNYFWDSVYKRDFSQATIQRYHFFLKEKYRTLARVSAHYKKSYWSWDSIPAPKSKSDRTITETDWHYDWFSFHDNEIRDYYKFLKSVWTDLGVKPTDVIFTSASSYNCTEETGLLPRLDYRDSDRLSLSTLDIYPKTEGSESFSTLNQPMKAAHDAALFASAHRQFFGALGDWVFATETQGGWFPPTEVTLEAREHTYGSLLGSGVKAMDIYYFHEGWNWDEKEKNDSALKFDAPLDAEMNARKSYSLIKSLGQALEGELGQRVRDSISLKSPFLLAHDSNGQYPIPTSRGEKAIEINSVESAALYGLFREAGITPEVGFVLPLTNAELSTYRAMIWNDPGYRSNELTKRFLDYIERGGTIFWNGPAPKIFRDRANVFVSEQNEASGWNDNRYIHLETAPKVLEKLRLQFDELSVTGPVKIKASDGRPFIHASLRSDRDHSYYLLFVENFISEKRSAVVSLAKSIVPNPRNVSLRRLFPKPSSEMLPLLGEIPVVSNGVDIWLITIRK
jgi:hypothetical protein